MRRPVPAGRTGDPGGESGDAGEVAGDPGGMAVALTGPDSPLPGGLTPAEADEKLLDAVAERVVRMGLAVPAIFLLESTKPLSFVGSQALVFLEPFVKSLFNLASYDRFVALLEDRKNIDRLLRKIEDRDEEARAEQKRQKAEEKARRAEEKARRSGGTALRSGGAAQHGGSVRQPKGRDEGAASGWSAGSGAGRPARKSFWSRFTRPPGRGGR